ncbi:MAG: TIGR02147 family protein [Fibrobacter sp.]|nr:TIGR02147 family protein [Fibrobacter sp.]
MCSIKKYLDYRDYLHDYYISKKEANAHFSLRYFGSKISIDPSHLVKIFQHQRHIGNASIEKIIDHCGFNASEAEYFANLVRFNKAKTTHDSKLYYEKMLSVKGVGAYALEKHQYEYYTKWYHSAILTFLDFYPFTNDYAALAAKLTPPITEYKARKSIELLHKLGLIKKRAENSDGKKGSWELTHKIITTGQRSLAVRSFQESTIELAKESLERHAPEKRNISTVTITVAEKNLDRVNEIITQARENILKLAFDEEHPDKVYQLNIQLFPLTQ